MKDEDKAKEQLINKLRKMRQRVAILEKSEVEHKQADEELWKSEEKYRTLVEGLEDVIVRFALDGTILYCSPNVNNFGGYDSKEEIGQHFTKYIADEEAKQELQGFFQGIIERKNTTTFEFRYMPKSKAPFYVEAKANPIINEKTGEIASIQCIVRDITGRKLMEEELIKYSEHLEEKVEERTAELNDTVKQLQMEITERKRAEEEFENIFNLSSDMMGVFTTEGGLIRVNPSWETILGYKAEELLEMGWATLVHPDDVERTNKEVEEQLKGSPVVDFINRYKCKDGSYKTLEWRATFAKEGIVYATARDITERKRAEEALGESEVRYRAIVEAGGHMGQAIFLLQDTDKVKAVHLFTNQEWSRITGYTIEELREISYYDVIHPRHHAAVADRVQRRLQGQDVPGRWEISVIARDGTEVPIEVTGGGPIRYQGKPATIGYAQDITERKQLEEERQRAAKLESVGTLAGGIAHDFNNILTGIMGNIGLAMRAVGIGEKDRATQRLEEAEKASIRARDLTQQLLTFSRGGAPIKKMVSITRLLKEAAGFALRGSNVRCDFNLPDDLWLVEIDEGQINQVIANLVINADQAMPEGGIINIGARNTVIKRKGALPLPKRNYLEITIEDHGVGISKEHLDKIFDPYFTTKQKGSGLGLATTYSILKKHDGHITAESELGIGTTFSIYLPASRKKQVSAKKEAIKEVPVRGEGKILVMDDEEVIREMLSKMLSLAGYEVTLAEDGAETIEQYTKAKEAGKPFGAVIMDLTIPGGMGGKEAIKKLLKIDPEAKVIVSSGYATDPIMADYEKYGFSAVVTKPYSVAQIEKTLQSLLGKRK